MSKEKPTCGGISQQTSEGLIRQSQHVENGVVIANFYYLDDQPITDERFSDIWNAWAEASR